MMTYKMKEDGNLYPELQLSNKAVHDSPLGKFGKQSLTFLQENNPIKFQELQMNGTLMEKMHEIDQVAKDKVIEMIKELEKSNPIPKTEDIYLRTQHKNQLKAQAEEIVILEYVHQIN
ncbi:TnpV protein [Virgibacillus sp. Bac332]|uniref:TnpV protein n=1 Tax=Virgibacillus sp. Bac332 TaxID=2419842 RepID=UPI000EF4EFED